MSNADLRAELSRLQSELRHLEAENARLQGELDRSISGLHNIHSGLTNYQNGVKNALVQARERLDSSEATAENAYGLQQQIEELYPLYKNMEEADKRIRELNNKKYYDFKNYRMIRKIMQGLMDNLDFSLVKEELIYKAVEKGHLQTPDYWLTCALLSIMSWKSDKREVAERAVAEAYRLSPKDSCVFYMIMNLRLGREETALNWLSLFEQQDLKRSDHETFLMMFSLISKTVYENVSTNVRNRVENFVNRIIRESMEREGYSEQQIISQISEYLASTRNNGTYTYPAIQQYSSDYGNLTNTLDLAENNYNILEKLRQIVNARIEDRNKFLKEYIDKLIEKPNDVEKDTYKEIDYNEKIILFKGDIAKAKAAFDEEQNYEVEEINLIYEMMNWIHAPEKEEVNPQMRTNMFMIMKNLEQNGYQLYRSIYLAHVKSIFHIKVNDYESDANLANPSSEYSKVRGFYSSILSQKLAGIKDTMAYVFFVLAAAAIVGGVFLMSAMALFAIGAAVLVIAGVAKLVGNRTERANLTKQCENNIESVSNIIQKMAGEYAKAMNLFGTYDAVSEEILDEFSTI